MGTHFAAALTAARTNAGFSQTEAARRLGVDQSAVSYWESGKNTPRASMLIKMADLYCCSIDKLMGRSAGRTGT